MFIRVRSAWENLDHLPDRACNYGPGASGGRNSRGIYRPGHCCDVSRALVDTGVHSDFSRSTEILAHQQVSLNCSRFGPLPGFRCNRSALF